MVRRRRIGSWSSNLSFRNRFHDSRVFRGYGAFEEAEHAFGFRNDLAGGDRVANLQSKHWRRVFGLDERFGEDLVDVKKTLVIRIEFFVEGQHGRLIIVKNVWWSFWQAPPGASRYESLSAEHANTTE